MNDFTIGQAIFILISYIWTYVISYQDGYQDGKDNRYEKVDRKK